MNYFEIFGIPVAPSVDRSLLSKKYIELQKKNHPDFFTNASEEEQDAALFQSSQINQGLKIFQHEDETIKYFLKLKGFITDDEKYQLPSDFLMEMMELNEDLSSQSAKQIEALCTTLHNEVKPLIDQYVEDITPETSLLKLKEYYYKKKYLQRILDRLKD